MNGEFQEEISYTTGEKIRLYKVKCPCGHVLSFITDNKQTCRHCGRLVYATKKKEFKDKLMKEIRKNV